MARPPSKDPVIKKSLCVPTSLHIQMVERMALFGFRTESAYVQALIRNDIVTGARVIPVMAAEPTPPVEPPKTKARGRSRR